MKNSPHRDLPLCLKPDEAGEDWTPPLDACDLSTRLESDGVTDSVARSRYNFDGTWEMAELWLPKIQQFRRVECSPVSSAPLRHQYWKGLTFALPLLISSMSILLLGYALWGGDLSIELATAVGLGTIASFLVTGGFVQVMARLGLFLIGTKQFLRAEKSTWWLLRTGTAAILLSAITFWATTRYWNWLPGELSGVAIFFGLALALFWLSAAVLHYLDRGLVLVGVTCAGIAIAAFLHLLLGLHLIQAQLLAIAVCDATAILIAARLLKKKREEGRVAFPALRPAEVLRLVPYFCYGSLYYLFLFTDRLIAWTAHTHASSLSFQFRADYESAVNLGLLAFVFQAGWVQLSIARFYRKLVDAQRAFSVAEIAGFRLSLIRFYWVNLGQFLLFAAVTCAVPLVLALGPLQHKIVFWTALGSVFGFPLLVIGLWNVSMLFALSQPWHAAASAGLACVADFTAGYFLSRLTVHHAAISGFVAGAFIFAAASGFWLHRAFRESDRLLYTTSG